MNNNLNNISEDIVYIRNNLEGKLYDMSARKTRNRVWHFVNNNIRINVTYNINKIVSDNVLKTVCYKKINKSLYNQIKNNYIMDII